jgi:hypothetical protein
MINCTAVAKIWMNPKVFVKIFSDFWEAVKKI